MKKPIFIITISLAVIIIALTTWQLYNTFTFRIEPIIPCPADAKLCPDGSAVGRTAPNCEFPACPLSTNSLTELQARAIAEKTCIKGGETLTPGYFNENSRTWWFDANLNATKEGCNPACVVSEETKNAEINWRCTGLKLPK